MTAITEDAFRAALNTLPIKSEWFPEGTVRFSLIKSHQSRDIGKKEIEQIKFHSCYLIGREATPSLSNRSRVKGKITCLELVKHRIVRIDSILELQSAISDLQTFGWCVDNDAYVIDLDGR